MGKKSKKSIGLKIFIVLLIGIILFFTKQDNQEKLIGFIKEESYPKSTSTLKTVESIIIDENVKDIEFYEKNIIIWQNNRLKSLGLDGSVKWEKEFNFNEPMVRFGEEKIYISEKIIGDIYIIDLEGEILKKLELSREINNVIEDFPNILIHTKNKDTDVENINILDKDGDIVDEIVMEDGNVLTYSVNRDENTYTVASLDLGIENLKSKMETFKLNEEILYSTIFNDEVILYSKYMGKNKMLVMSDNNLYFIDRDNILWEKQLHLVKDIYIDEDKINILSGNKLEVITLGGKVQEKYSFTEEYNNITFYDKLLVLYGNNNVIGLKNDKELFKYNSEGIIMKVLVNKKNLIILYEDKIDILSF